MIVLSRSVRIYQSNGNKNGAGVAKVSSGPTVHDLITGDISTPGYVRLPVCGPALTYVPPAFCVKQIHGNDVFLLNISCMYVENLNPWSGTNIFQA